MTRFNVWILWQSHEEASNVEMEWNDGGDITLGNTRI
jgi:hypothetical protein